MTLMFGVVQNAIAVKPATAAVVDGKVEGEGSKKRKMDVARKHLENGTGPCTDCDERNGAIFKKLELALIHIANKHLTVLNLMNQ